MFRYIFFLIISAAIIYFFGERLYKWFKSIFNAAKRVENNKWSDFDKMLNPPLKRGKK